MIGSDTIPLEPLPVTALLKVSGPLVIQGQTLTPGGLITVANIPTSLPTSGSELIVGGKSTPGSQAVVGGLTASGITRQTDVIIGASITASLGGAILSALGITPTTTAPAVGSGSAPTRENNGTTVSPARFTGGSSPLTPSIEIWKTWLLCLSVGLGGIVVGAWT